MSPEPAFVSLPDFRSLQLLFLQLIFCPPLPCLLLLGSFSVNIITLDSTDESP